jgi:hypothetical protein
MCGIFGVCVAAESPLNQRMISKIVKKLFLLSESRGKEAAGLAIRSAESISVHKEAVSASKMVAGKRYRTFLEKELSTERGGSSLYLTGHARLVTNGLQDMDFNNQPVVKDKLIGVHNGIITNDEALWHFAPDFKRECEVDTEVLLAMIAQSRKDGESLTDAVRNSFARLEGNASLSLLFSDADCLLLATNNGSLYIAQMPDTEVVLFASERVILEGLFAESELAEALGQPAISHLEANSSALIAPDGKGFGVSRFSLLGEKSDPSSRIHSATPLRITNTGSADGEARAAMRRCTRCVLPETMPFIEFDDEGVCNYCRGYKPMHVEPEGEGRAVLAPYRGKGKDADCLVMLSGGRDSCFGLHYAVTELGMKPIAYTYDWGMVTDIARRNAARLCGKLGVEHIIVSADIAWKRRNIRKNIEAWLKKPNLGMIPLFMAGDKQYFYYANKICQVNKLPISIVSENPLEYTKFKAGFCGVDESSVRIFDISFAKKAKLFSYYAKQYLSNPAYINSTLFDSAFAFWSSYFLKHNYFFLANYHRWDEQEIVSTLIDEYNWETDPECAGTWRIGDGTAAFYNYIYYTVAGFTENDTLRSNLVREGVISRKEALRLVKVENRPRWESMKWYASVVGFNLTDAVQTINAIPKLYTQKH